MNELCSAIADARRRGLEPVRWKISLKMMIAIKIEMGPIDLSNEMLKDPPLLGLPVEIIHGEDAPGYILVSRGDGKA